MPSRVQGLAEAYSLLDAVPEAAREELAVELAIIAREDILPEQRRLVAKDTGHLESGLGIQLDLERLRVRVGLFGIGSTRRGSHDDGRYYGRFVNFGRKAQTVRVERRRRVKGRLRASRGRKRAEDIAARYKLRVKAAAARPFIQVPGAEASALKRLETFWAAVLARSGAA
jgi:hypothetical protein